MSRSKVTDDCLSHCRGLNQRHSHVSVKIRIKSINKIKIKQNATSVRGWEHNKLVLVLVPVLTFGSDQLFLNDTHRNLNEDEVVQN